MGTFLLYLCGMILAGLPSAAKEIVGSDTNGVYDKLDHFIKDSMGGAMLDTPPNCDRLYSFNGFKLNKSSTQENGKYEGYMNGESNLGQWTMRLCDYMVDQVGEWDLIVCNSDNLSTSFRHGSGDNKYWLGVAAREMQMVFRHRPGGRAVFMAAAEVKELGRPPLQPPPYWTEPGCINGTLGQKLIPGSRDELAWMQEILDKTFKNKTTRDRKDGQPLADRFVAVQCVRSEHPGLWDRFAERRKVVAESCKTAGALESFTTPKTMDACQGLAQRCTHASVGNPANQAYLLHGTNPTSAVAILNSSFTVNLAGKSAGGRFISQHPFPSTPLSLCLRLRFPEAQCLARASTWRRAQPKPTSTLEMTWGASMTACMRC